ncbi:hypothetical protein [Mesorhizobium sp. NZP2298]|uniref:hypothetical protein n=1 Tax=Mesorhizobium sp. NZP2298 TaxID=2483403 RepID=UPI00155369C7|nr:hypothetical protein [Mesorhizobium sp. NZP2298]QKC98283.1 hypothetical protein EB231_29275 [Mesorhizobium sp. NZP2298]
MPTYQVEEFYGEKLVSSKTVQDDEPMKAAEQVVGGPVSPRALQEHWFRVVDERRSAVHEFSLAEPGKPGDFAK